MTRVFTRLYRWIVLFIAGLVLCVAINTLPSWQPNSLVVAQPVASNQLVQQGMELYQAGKLPEALARLQQALEQTSAPQDRAVVLSNLATVNRELGKLDKAIDQWQQAIQIYQSRNDDNSRNLLAKVLTEQAQAYSDLGQNQTAIKLLQSAVEISHKSQDKNIEAAAQGALGNAYRALGDYEQAINISQTALKIARELKNPGYITTTLNNLGNIYASAAQQERYQANTANLEGDNLAETTLTKMAKEDTIAAIDAFKQSVEESKDLGGMAQVRALLNFNLMLAKTPSNSIPSAPDLIAANRAQALELLKTQPDSQEKAYALINLAVSPIPSKEPGVKTDRSKSTQLLEQGLQVARNIGSRRGESFALGTLGQVYESDKQYDKAMELTRQAEFAAQEINAADSLYRWQWQAARIFKAMGEREKAIDSYQRSIATLQSIRSDIVAANKDLQFNFRDSVEPVYRQLIGLFLEDSQAINSASIKAEPAKNTQELSKALDVLELLKLAELQNYFGDECVQVALDNATKERVALGSGNTSNILQIAQDKAFSGKVKPDNTKTTAHLKLTDPNSVVIYSVILEDRSQMILELANGSLIGYPVSMGASQMQTEIDKLRALLEKRSTDQYLLPAKKIYDLLIRPMEADLAAAKPSTLIFIQDGVLRNVPMSALHDGKEYLIQKYAIATTPSLSLTIPKPLERGNLNALIAGLTVARPPFDALPNVKAEAAGVKKILGGTELLDQNFTLANFQDHLQKNTYSVIHLATHGKFGVNNENTFLVGYDGLISIEEIDNLLRTQSSKHPVELLTLSACQTAAGDNRSALGMAGVAVRAGVKSALATLWFINDESTVQLVEDFYTQLRQPNVSRAEALRKAQLKLIADKNYNHPAVWSPFILIGNWM